MCGKISAAVEPILFRTLPNANIIHIMKLILFRGRPGTGKTTLSQAFAQRVNFPILRKDDVYDVTAEFITEHNARNKISYRALYKILESNTGNGSTFILDYPFQHPGDLDILRAWCADHKATLKSILVTCSDEKVWAQRLDERAKNPAPNQLITDFDSFKKLYGTMHLSPEADELCVDTVRSVEDIVANIVEFA